MAGAADHPAESYWEALLSARDGLNAVIKAEREAAPERWAAFVARRAGKGSEVACDGLG